MRTSKTIAGLIGPTLVAVAVAVVLNLGSFPALAEQVSRDPALILLSGILLFVAGLAIVRAHNIWAGGWPVLVTVFGWLILLGGLARMLFPDPNRRNRGRGWPKHRPDRCSGDRPSGAWRHPLVQGLQPRVSEYG